MRLNVLNAVTNKATVVSDTYDPNPSNNKVTLVTPIEGGLITECVIVPKIYSTCQIRRCFPNIEIDLPESYLTLESICFNAGILSNELIMPIPTRPGFARVQYNLVIPYEITLHGPDERTITLVGNTPSIHEDIVLYYPEMRSELSFQLHINTRSNLLGSPMFTENHLILSVGTFIVTYVVLQLQLQIPTYGYCPEPEPCEALPIQPNRCANFLNPSKTSFLDNFMG